METTESIETTTDKRTCPYCNSDRTESKGYRNAGLPNEAIRYTCLACGKSHSRYTATGEVITRQKKEKKQEQETKQEDKKEDTDKMLVETGETKTAVVEAIKKDIANQTLNVKQSTKDRLTTFKKYTRETVDDIIVRLMDSAERRKKRVEEEDAI